MRCKRSYSLPPAFRPHTRGACCRLHFWPNSTQLACMQLHCTVPHSRSSVLLQPASQTTGCMSGSQDVWEQCISRRHLPPSAHHVLLRYTAAPLATHILMVMRGTWGASHLLVLCKLEAPQALNLCWQRACRPKACCLLRSAATFTMEPCTCVCPAVLRKWTDLQLALQLQI